MFFPLKCPFYWGVLPKFNQLLENRRERDGGLLVELDHGELLEAWLAPGTASDESDQGGAVDTSPDRFDGNIPSGKLT